jgi:YidC/Oxa1 family membrane protein insertase
MYTFLGIIAKPMGWLLGLLYDVIGNYGIAVIIFTIVVKTALYPLYIKQTKSMAAMSTVQPKMQEIQRKYANDQQMMNQKLAELYKEEHFNPMGGCLPMLIQMPIIMGLFALLRNPMQYITDESMLFAVHESFMWIMDLSQPDKWILPLLAGAATFLSFFINQKNNNSSTQMGPAAQMNQSMKMMQYIFPIMIIWMGRSFPAGLALYWAIGQVMQIFFNMHMKTVREKAMKEAKNKKKKK